MNEQHDIDHLLKQRGLPHAPHDLADRILYRAVRTPQMTKLTWQGMANECLALLLVPRPALAFGLCLMIGVGSGWLSTQSANAETMPDNTQALNMVVIEESW